MKLHEDPFWSLTLKEFGSACANCGCGGVLTRDHWVPNSVRRFRSKNINQLGRYVPLCQKCNHMKGDKMPAEFMIDAARRAQVSAHLAALSAIRLRGSHYAEKLAKTAHEEAMAALEAAP